MRKLFDELRMLIIVIFILPVLIWIIPKEHEHGVILFGLLSVWIKHTSLELEKENMHNREGKR